MDYKSCFESTKICSTRPSVVNTTRRYGTKSYCPSVPMTLPPKNLFCPTLLRIDFVQWRSKLMIWLRRRKEKHGSDDASWTRRDNDANTRFDKTVKSVCEDTWAPQESISPLNLILYPAQSLSRQSAEPNATTFKFRKRRAVTSLIRYDLNTLWK